MAAVRQPDSLPMSAAEMRSLGWDALDVLLITGDACVDHPSFGMALLGRWLMAHGFRVGVVAQPRWDSPADIASMGRPRLFAGVTAGAMDSMLAHYTAFRKKRRDDAYTPGGAAGARPNRATLVYTNLVRQAFPKLPVVLGGIEASLRRVSHYDFWSDTTRRSILLDSKADLICYGMAERALLAVAECLADGGDCFGIPGTVAIGSRDRLPPAAEVMELPAHEAVVADRRLLLALSVAQERQVHRPGALAIQDAGDRTVVVAPMPDPLSEAEMDRLYGLPFSRHPHPSYGNAAIPAAAMIRDSITSHRGCGGGCSFCSLALHQGRRIRSRSQASLRQECEALGRASDVGGPTANMWGARCDREWRCDRASCLFPGICPHFRMDHDAQLAMLRALQASCHGGLVRVASGIRYDLALQSPETAQALVREFVGGQLKVAPEHVAPPVLAAMRKPDASAFERYLQLFGAASRRADKEQYVIPYLMSAFPGCTDADMKALAAWLRRRNWRPQQVQCFIPTPGTVATGMFVAGADLEGNAIYVARSDAERLRQHRILVNTTEPTRPLPSPGRRRRDATEPDRRPSQRKGRK